MKKRNALQMILQFPLTRIIVGIIAIVGLYISAQTLFSAPLKGTSLSRDLQGLCIGIGSSVVAMLAYIFLYKFYEQRKISEFAFPGITKHLLRGIALGATLQALTILVIWLKGGYTVLVVNNLWSILPALAMAFSSAIFEEILLRGIIFRIMEGKLGSYIALAISALIFGALHLANPNSSALLALGLAIQAGLLLGAAYMLTRNLWFPIAIHFAWNFVQSGIFGAAVSGNSMGKSLLRSEIKGDDWFTGGLFGPEGSVQATLFCLTAMIILLILCQRRSKIITPFWVKTM